MEGMQEWLAKFKPAKWVMVDIDNWMLGNPLLQNNQLSEYSDPVFKGSQFDPSKNIDLRNV